MKVGKKVFAFLGVPGTGFGMGVKLPDSAGAVLSLPFDRVRRVTASAGAAGWR